MSEVRLQKFLAECGIGSRRKMEQFITEGRVRVNGKVVTELGRKVDPNVDKVEVNRRPVHAAPKGILLLHKPRGVMSTLSDPEGRPTVADYLTKHYRSFFPVGRLDWDSTGLMVMTNDGELAEYLMHPRYGFERVYEARVEGSVSIEKLEKLQRGITLSDGVAKAAATILRGDEKSTWIEIRVQEGRNRLVRRMFDKLGHPVMKLRRTVYGPFKLGRLQSSQVRALTLKEYEQVRRRILSSVKGTTQEESPRDEHKPRRAFRSSGGGSRGERGRGVNDRRTSKGKRRSHGRPRGQKRRQRG